MLAMLMLLHASGKEFMYVFVSSERIFLYLR
jgi:hypothetical protein